MLAGFSLNYLQIFFERRIPTASLILILISQPTNLLSFQGLVVHHFMEIVMEIVTIRYYLQNQVPPLLGLGIYPTLFHPPHSS
jgi:hypothetical protein